MRQLRIPSTNEDDYGSQDAVRKSLSDEELLNKAFDLAYFIQGERNTAVRIVASAMIKLQLATSAQNKRLYYKPIGRGWPQHSQSEIFRNKVSFNELHLLQRLIYLESEPYEIQKERGINSLAPDQREMLTHFIKHLVRITIKRNSFYVTLGLSRLLYHYSTAETMELYNVVIQDPDRVKDDYYYRSRKGVLMQELKQRFGDLLKVCRGAHGEERFEAHHNPGRFLDIVEECLNAFTPWSTPCLVPASANPMTDGIPHLSYQGEHEEDKVEVHRFHAVLHPNCLHWLTKALGFQSPDQRLEIPSFSLSSSNDGPGRSSRRPPASLDEDELQSIQRDLDEQSRRRKAASAGLLRIMVDGVECSRLDLKRTGSVDFNLNGEPELIEIRGCNKVGDELLLATHLIANRDQNAAPKVTSIVLESGQKLSVTVSPQLESSTSLVNVKYQETVPLRAASLYFSRLGHLISNGEVADMRTARPVWKAVGVCALLAVFVVAGLLYVQRRPISNVQSSATSVQPIGPSESGGSQTVAQGNLTTVPTQTSKLKTGVANQQPSEKSRETKVAQVSPGSSQPEAGASSEASSSEGELTRSVAGRSTAVPLRNVKTVYLDAPNDGGLRQQLLEVLHASTTLSVSQDRKDADALLRVSYKNVAGITSVVVNLIGVNGETIWPTAVTRSRGVYRGPIADISKSIVKDLLAEIR